MRLFAPLHRSEISCEHSLHYIHDNIQPVSKEQLHIQHKAVLLIFAIAMLQADTAGLTHRLTRIALCKP
jgi:hypothetical protein